VVHLVGLEAAAVADAGEDRDAVGDGNADSDVALLVLGDAGHPGVYAVVQRGADAERTTGIRRSRPHDRSPGSR
jgi:hypothetical protein